MPPAGGPVDWPEAVAAGALDRNSYDYRLVVSRKLYDRAVGTALSPSLAGLATSSAAHVNPLDLAALGVADGTEVQVSGPRGSVVLPLAADAGGAARLAAVPFNVPGAAIADIVDARAPANDVRVERM